MCRLLSEGRVRAIGVNDAGCEHLDALARESDIVQAVNQIEIHPGWMQPDTLSRCPFLRELPVITVIFSS